MTANGDVPSGAGGVNEPDWIDQILERATQQVDSLASERRNTPLPIVPDEPPAHERPANGQASAPVDQPALPVNDAVQPIDQLAEIRWADEPQVTPASTPVVRADGSSLTTDSPALTADKVGRSAWDAELASVGDGDPEGWDKLNWQDLDGKSEPSREVRPAGDFSGVVREWGPVLFMAVAIALFIRLVIVQAYHIPSPSMVPTLEKGDRVVVNRLSYRFGEIDRGQVIVFEKPANTDGENDLIKRVLALPGETIRFVDNQVYIDGRRVEEPYLLRPDSTQPRSAAIPGCAQDVPMRDQCEVPLGYVFVMGDNREGSSDSRVFGPIPTDSVVGRAFLKVWPLNDVGQL